MDTETRTYKINDPEIIYLRRSDEQLDFAIQLIGDLSYKIHTDPFSFLMDTIIGQMLSNKVGKIISGRFRDLCCGNMSPDAVCQLSVDELRQIGISRDKSNYLLSFARYIENNPNYFNYLETLSDKELLDDLQSHRGIGGWSSKMYAIFVLDRKNILPFEDGAFLQTFKWLYGVEEHNRNHPIIREMCKKWFPYSSIAARYMYRILDNEFTKKDVNKVKTEINFTPISTKQ